MRSGNYKRKHESGRERAVQATGGGRDHGAIRCAAPLAVTAKLTGSVASLRLWGGRGPEHRVCDRAGDAIRNAVEVKKLVALYGAARDFSRIVGGLQIVSDGDDGKKNRGERTKRDELHRNRWEQRPALHLAPLGAPESPKGDGNRQPSEVAK